MPKQDDMQQGCVRAKREGANTTICNDASRARGNHNDTQQHLTKTRREREGNRENEGKKDGEGGRGRKSFSTPAA